MRPTSCVQTVFAIILVMLANISILAAAEAIPKAVIAIVDVNHVLASSSAMKNAEKTLREKAKIVTNSLKLEGEKLMADKAQLDQQKTILTQEVYRQKLDALNLRRQQLQRQAQESSGQLNRALNGIRGKLRQRIIQLAAGVGAKNGANLGMDRANTVFFDNTMDITEKVLTAFNKANPKVSITIEKAQ